ncbi:MAG: hypothetical protein OEZ59_02825 [Deltaproteobacteria bacterium]|nr:hypothetical protein [Deltaproteobacteria bacterium]
MLAPVKPSKNDPHYREHSRRYLEELISQQQNPHDWGFVKSTAAPEKTPVGGRGRRKSA